MKHHFLTKNIIVATNIAFAITCVFLSGCNQKLSEDKRTEVARLYTEILIAEQMYGDDTLTINRFLDSLLDGTDYENIDEIEGVIKGLAQEDPDGLRAMFDSTQKGLERIRKGEANDSTRSISDTATR